MNRIAVSSLNLGFGSLSRCRTGQDEIDSLSPQSDAPVDR